MSTKNIILLIVAVVTAALLFYGGCQCERRRTLKTVGTVKTVTKDSVIIRYKPVPYMVLRDSLIYVKGKPVIVQVHDTLPPLIERITEPVDTGKILEAYYTTSYYYNEQDTGRFTIISTDTVTQNRITGKSLYLKSSDTATTNTVLIKPPRNFVMYFALSAMGNRHEPLGGAGIGLAAKLPNDKVFILQYKTIRNNQPMIEATALLPIRFKKRN